MAAHEKYPRYDARLTDEGPWVSLRYNPGASTSRIVQHTEHWILAHFRKPCKDVESKFFRRSEAVEFIRRERATMGWIHMGTLMEGPALPNFYVETSHGG